MPSSRSMILAASILGCAPKADPIAPGISTVTEAPSASSRKVASSANSRWEHFDALKSWPVLSSDPFVSTHLDGRHRAAVRTNDVARDAYLALLPGKEMPLGSIVVELLHDSESGRAGPAFTMQKLAPGRWQYAVVEQDGTVLTSATTLCRRCHAEAVSDQLFGLPDAARPTAH